MKQIIFSCILMLLFCACAQQKQDQNIATISVDVNSATLLNSEDTLHTIKLDNDNKALISGSYNLFMLHDKIIMYSGNDIVLFNSDGSYIKHIGSLGKAENEYLKISDAFINHDTICIFDSGDQKVLRFNLDGEYISTERLELEYRISKMQPLGINKFIGMTMYQGKNSTTPIFCNFNDIIFAKSKMAINSGIFLHKVFSCYNDTAIYWNMLNDTIYSISEQLEVRPKYIVDFGKFAMPNSLLDESMDEKFEFIVTKNPDVIINPQYVTETDNFLAFTFALKSDTYISTYNKKTKTIKTTKLDLDTYAFTTLYSFINDQFVFVCRDKNNLDANNTLVSIMSSNLL